MADASDGLDRILPPVGAGWKTTGPLPLGPGGLVMDRLESVEEEVRCRLKGSFVVRQTIENVNITTITVITIFIIQY
jgi:hypothetical protein